jgi:hypothetical protein
LIEEGSWVTALCQKCSQYDAKEFGKPQRLELGTASKEKLGSHIASTIYKLIVLKYLPM